MKRLTIKVTGMEKLSTTYSESVESFFERLAADDEPKTAHRALPGLVAGLMLMLSGCMTIPKGEHQLGPKIAEDLKQQRMDTTALSRGRPLYLEAYAYPQMLDTGDIWAGGPVLLNIGREELSLDALIGDLGAPGVEPQEKPEARKGSEDDPKRNSGTRK